MKNEIFKGCPVGRALEVIGDKWSLLIIRNMLRLGAQRFQDLEDSISGIAPNTLSARLKLLTAQGVVARRFYEEHPPRAEYHLTDKGRALGPVLKALYKWGEEYG
jgi:DNA-binding HxlR family transcriptional regulator